MKEAFLSSIFHRNHAGRRYHDFIFQQQNHAAKNILYLMCLPHQQILNSVCQQMQSAVFVMLFRFQRFCGVLSNINFLFHRHHILVINCVILCMAKADCYDEFLFLQQDTRLYNCHITHLPKSRVSDPLISSQGDLLLSPQYLNHSSLHKI